MTVKNSADLPLVKKETESYRRECHERWVGERNRRMEASDYKDEWYREQCGNCQYWIALSGPLGDDWGVCSNLSSPFDGKVRQEHDGCEDYADAGVWGDVVVEDSQ